MGVFFVISCTGGMADTGGAATLAYFFYIQRTCMHSFLLYSMAIMS